MQRGMGWQSYIGNHICSHAPPSACTCLTNGAITFAAGKTSKNITIASIISDSLDEPNETVILTLSDPTNASLGTIEHTYTITDDDTAPSLSINDVSYTESGSAGNATFTVTLSAASGKDVEVDYASSNGTAASGSDYTAASGTVTILAGNTTQTFNVPVLVDHKSGSADMLSKIWRIDREINLISLLELLKELWKLLHNAGL